MGRLLLTQNRVSGTAQYFLYGSASALLLSISHLVPACRCFGLVAFVPLVWQPWHTRISEKLASGLAAGAAYSFVTSPYLFSPANIEALLCASLLVALFFCLSLGVERVSFVPGYEEKITSGDYDFHEQKNHRPAIDAVFMVQQKYWCTFSESRAPPKLLICGFR
jgi:hypothetical protein